jgi:hypothetical protein
MLFVNFLGYMLSIDSIINDELASEVERSGHNLCKGFPIEAEETPCQES